ncbi:unnamed protein product [Prunus armeniaca]
MGRIGESIPQRRWGWGIPDMNMAGMKAGMGEKCLTEMGMGMSYPPLIRSIAIPNHKTMTMSMHAVLFIPFLFITYMAMHMQDNLPKHKGK